MEAFIDIENALADSGGYGSMYAPPLPEDFATSLPCALFTRVGGTIEGRVLSTHNVSVDVYAETWEQAQLAGAWLGAHIDSLGGQMIGYGEDDDRIEVPVYTASCQAPYNNPDPKHPNVCRVTFLATLATRTITL